MEGLQSRTRAASRTEVAAAATTPRRLLGALWWGTRLAAALFLFVGALQVMKTGAEQLDVLRHGGLLVHDAASTLGLGWIGALLVLSGSPVAASGLALVAAGSISEVEGFTMLTGSRLGAAFVVLLVAVVYALRGGKGERRRPVSTAVMALSTTALVYLPGAMVGLALLRWEPFGGLRIRFPSRFGTLIDVVYGGLMARLEGLPAAVLFLAGLGILLASFKVIDGVLPSMTTQRVESSSMAWLRRKWPMFGLGCVVALVTMSVSVALTVLVPLVSKKYVKREHVIPYIVGANITTLGDTLLAALVLQSASAVRIVLAGIAGTTVVSLGLLAFLYPQMRQAIWRFQRQVTMSKLRLAIFTAGLFAIPVLLIALGPVA